MRRLSFPDEKELLMQIASGNEEAFNFLFDHYHQLLALHIFRISGSMTMAEEVVQDVFLKIWLKREQLINVNNIKAYLHTLSKNHAINYLKQEARLRQKQTELIKLENFSKEAPEENDLYLYLDEAVDRLPLQQKTVYLLSRHNRLKYAQIADKMGISTETVKTYLKRATISIKSHIKNQNFNILAFLFTLTAFLFKR